MYLKTMIVASSLALATSAFAQTSTQNTKPSDTPGHQMQQKGPKGDMPGASGYAPGHNKENTGSTQKGTDTMDKTKGTKGSSGTSGSNTR